MNMTDEMQQTVQRLTAAGRGILAADESHPTIKKRLEAFGIESTEENRRAYRSLLVTTPGIGEYVSGIIFFEETLGQKTDGGQGIPEACEAAGIVPGIKVDKGLVELPGTDGEKVTQGLDGLGERLDGYKAQGARFTKWRSVFNIEAHKPSDLAIAANAEVLARYAAVVQSRGMVPIVEPEVLMDGDHSIGRCEEVTGRTLDRVFEELEGHRVAFSGMILKPNMVISGSEAAERAGPREVAEATLRCLKAHVPAEVPGIAFLSGGQSAEEATEHLSLMNQMDSAPWRLSFSYGRALQAPALEAWGGKAGNFDAGQRAFAERAKLNGLATSGRYNPDMEAA